MRILILCTVLFCVGFSHAVWPKEERIPTSVATESSVTEATEHYDDILIIEASRAPRMQREPSLTERWERYKFAIIALTCLILAGGVYVEGHIPRRKKR